jgi:YrbI family 3-deoxy-D-manno-octulosonate 8-phosphate phosphatase
VSRGRRPRWAAVRALVTDVDGVLTDGGLYYAENGDELKRFDVRDGQGLVLLREAGLLTAIVTRKRTALVRRRARDLGIVEVHQNVTDKAAVLADLLARHRLAAAAVCYVGDDVGDLPAMRAVGVGRRRRRGPDGTPRRHLHHPRPRRPWRHPRSLRPHPLCPPPQVVNPPSPPP